MFQYAADVGYHMTLLDIGGGYPGRKNDMSNKLFSRISVEIKKGLEHFSGCSDLKVISEPGELYIRIVMLMNNLF